MGRNEYIQQEYSALPKKKVTFVVTLMYTILKVHCLTLEKHILGLGIILASNKYMYNTIMEIEKP